jgi:hypothetical protein
MIVALIVMWGATVADTALVIWYLRRFERWS